MSEQPPGPGEGFTAEARPERPAPVREESPPLELSEPLRAPPFWRRHGPSALVAAVVAALTAALVSTVFVLLVPARGRSGASAARAGAGASTAGDLLTQDGKVRLGVGAKEEVYYPMPYGSPPNLQLDTTDPNVNWNAVRLEEQTATHFTVRSTAGFGVAVEIRWHASGLRKGG